MSETLQETWQKIIEFWEEKDKKQKISMGIGSLAFILIVTFMILKFTSTKYEVLYGDLSLKDMGQITTKLDEMDVEWETGEQNNSILVPADDKNKIKIELATHGLPKEGYDLSDLISDLGWSMTDSDKKIVEKEFVESSLETTLLEMDGVSDVRVHVGDDTRTSFVLDNINNDMSASVFIVKDSNKNFGNEQVKAVKHIVAGRLGMVPEDVSVTDNEGNLLDGESEKDGFNLEQFAVKEELEGKIDKSVTKLLTDMYGIGNVSVKSSVKINMNEESSESVEYSPIEGTDGGIIRSQEEESERMKGGTPGNPPGVDINVEDYEILDEYSDEYSRDKKIVNNEINEIRREIKTTPGQIDGVTVAVILNSNSIPGGELTEEKKEEITNLVFAATGGDTERVEVFAEDFGRGMALEDSEAEEGGLNLKILIPLLIVLILVGAGIFLYMRRKREEEELELEQALLDQAIEDQMQDEEYMDELEFELEESNMKKQIDKFVDEKPEAVTQLLRSWLND